MQYAKLIDGALQYAPNPIRIDGQDIITTDPTPYGYKLVVYPDPPQEAGYYVVPDGWEETETEIRHKWRLEPTPEPELTLDDLTAAIVELADIIGGDTNG